MLGLTMNAEAEKIVKSAAREAGCLQPVPAVISNINGSSENGASAAPQPSGSRFQPVPDYSGGEENDRRLFSSLHITSKDSLP